MRRPKGVPCAACGIGALVALPHVAQRQDILRCRRIIGLTSGKSISSYSPITSPIASSTNGRPQYWQCAGRWSSCASAVSARARACPLCPGLAPPGREPSRLPLRSVDGGFDDVRDVLSGRCRPSNRSINSGFVSRSSSSRFIGSVNHRPTTLARGWVITQTDRKTL